MTVHRAHRARAFRKLASVLGPLPPNMWREFGCPLAFAEYLLIGVAGLLFPGDLLNDQGENRAASEGADSVLLPGGPVGGSEP